MGLTIFQAHICHPSFVTFRKKPNSGNLSHPNFKATDRAKTSNILQHRVKMSSYLPAFAFSVLFCSAIVQIAIFAFAQSGFGLWLVQTVLTILPITCITFASLGIQFRPAAASFFVFFLILINLITPHFFYNCDCGNYNQTNNQINDESLSSSFNVDDQLETFFGWRFAELEKLKKERHIYNLHPNPYEFHPDLTIGQFLELEKNWSQLENKTGNETVSVAGRLLSIKSLDGSRLIFIVAQNGSELSVLTESHTSARVQAQQGLQVGDIIGVVGKPFKSDKGKLSLLGDIRELQILVPIFRTLLPVNESEQREIRTVTPQYIKHLLNPELRNNFFLKSKIIGFLRRYLESCGYLEVHSPILHPVPKGAYIHPYLARTQLRDQNYVLRDTAELNLKRLIISGFERVFDVGHRFRNDEADSSHNSEFTSLEFLETYLDYEGLMQRVETALSGLVKSLFGTLKIKLRRNVAGDGDESGVIEEEIDFTPPFRRIQVMPALEKALGFSLAPYETFGSSASVKKLLETQEDLRRGEFTWQTSMDYTEGLVEALIKRYVEQDCIQPTFITDYPLILGHFAQSHPNTSGLTERFELFVMKLEIANAYTKLTDPLEQLARYYKKNLLINDHQVRVDSEYLEAIQYGLPPVAGAGFGIERLAMLLTNSSIQDVILLPS